MGEIEFKETQEELEQTMLALQEHMQHCLELCAALLDKAIEVKND